MKLITNINIKHLFLLLTILHLSNANNSNTDSQRENNFINVNAVMIKDTIRRDMNVPEMRKYKLFYQNDGITLTPNNKRIQSIDINYIDMIFLDGKMIFTLEESKNFKNKFYSVIKNN